LHNPDARVPDCGYQESWRDAKEDAHHGQGSLRQGLWVREGLPRKTRSMLNLAMISVLNRPHELRAHIRGALRNGVSREEISEVFLQVMIYAGAPAAVDAFRTAREVFAEMDKKA